MNRLLVSLGFVVALAPAALALGAAEAISGGAAQAFHAMSAFKAKSGLRSLSAANGEARKLKAAGSQRYVRLRGHVNVWGNAHVPQGQNGSVWITVSGDTQLQDETGRYLNGTVSVSDSSHYFVNGNHVNGWARPSANVSLYRNNRYLGNIRIEGSIPVSGWNNGGWVRLSGSGWVEGSGYVYDADEPQAP